MRILVYFFSFCNNSRTGKIIPPILFCNDIYGFLLPLDDIVVEFFKGTAGTHCAAFFQGSNIAA